MDRVLAIVYLGATIHIQDTHTARNTVVDLFRSWGSPVVIIISIIILQVVYKRKVKNINYVVEFMHE